MGRFWLREIVLWALAVLVVGLNAGFGIYNVRKMVDSERLLLRTRMTCAELAAVLSDMKDAETGHRGYLMTGQAEYLDPFQEANKNVWGRVEDLRLRFEARPGQLERLETLEKLIRAKFAMMNRTIAIRDARGRDEAAVAMIAGDGKTLMDEIRRVSAETLEQEEAILTEREVVADAHYRTAELTTIIGAALAIAVLTITATVVYREMQTRARLGQSLSTAKAETEKAFGQLGALVQNATHGIAFFDSELRILRVNTVFAQLNDLGVEEHFGRTLAEVTPELPEEILAEYRNVLAGGPPLIRREFHAKGRVWEVSAFPVPTDIAELGLGVMGIDITEQYLAQIHLRESETRFRNMAETMPQIVWIARPDGHHEYFNARWFEYTGCSVEETFGSKWNGTLHPDDAEKTERRWATSLATGELYECENRVRGADGNYRWFLARAAAVKGEAGQILRWLGTSTDIDDRKRQAEILEELVVHRTQALQTSNAELVRQQSFIEAILQSVEEGIVACDADGQLQLFNAATRRMHGLPPEPIPPELWAEHYRLFESDGITPMTMERVPLYRAWRGERVTDADLVIRPNHPERSERYVLCSGQQLRTPDGKLFGAVVSMRDMTVRLEHERQLAQTAAALKASNEELEKFAYIASHDLQEPLRKIQAFGDRLLKKHRETLGETGKDYLDRMLDSAGRMRRLIEDLLAFSRINTNVRPVESVDLGEVVRGVLLDLEDQVRRTGATVSVGPLPRLPADAVQMRQLFQNLLGNAMKFARPDVPPVVTVESEPLENGWRIAVADNGIGFEPRHSERIFELFQRLHGRSQYEGTGLGLAIVKKIVVRHGATIAARSSPGGGATFTIDWPNRESGNRHAE